MNLYGLFLLQNPFENRNRNPADLTNSTKTDFFGGTVSDCML